MCERALFKTLLGPEKIKSIEYKISNFGGRVIDGSLGKELDPFIKQQFDQFGERIIGTSKGIDKLEINNITAIGGWCAIRTADYERLKQGVVPNPLTGEVLKYNSPRDVAEWIEQAISIDQIIEAIGIYSGQNYAAISEEKLWGDRVKQTVANKLRRSLTNKEKVEIDIALDTAETRRYEFTQRYIDYITQRKNNLIRFVDGDIWQDLVRVRNEMLKIAKIDLNKLLKMFPEEIASIPGYSIVWGMYTGPYLALLKSKGYVSTSKGVIIEPYTHALSETRSKAYINDQIFGYQTNNYLVPKGVNKDLGFAAFIDAVSPKGERLGRIITLDGLPNFQNYQDFLKRLSEDPRCGALTLSDNPSFIWGVNLFPYGVEK